MTKLLTTYPIPDNLPAVIIKDSTLPLVSVVTPSYNQGRYIRQTIESILSQDYPNLEYWVIDGGSTDETVSILKEYGHDPRFHYLSEPDKGQSDAINKGLVRCHGEIFAWLNSDDVYYPDILRHVVDEWLAAGEPAIIYGLARFIDEKGNDLGCCAGQAPNMDLEKLLSFGKYYIPQPALFFPKEYMLNAGGVDLSLHYTMDYDLLLKLAEQLSVQHLPLNVALYRLHSESKTVATADQFIHDLSVVLNRAVKRGIISAKKAESRVRLFAARTYLSPEAWDVLLGLKSLRQAISNDRAATVEAISILFKSSLRLLIGEKYWSKIRVIQMKLRESTN